MTCIIARRLKGKKRNAKDKKPETRPKDKAIADVLEQIPVHLRCGWYAYLNSGEKVVVETILTNGNGTRIVRINHEEKRKLVPLSTFSSRPCPFPDWMQKGAKIRTSAGAVGRLTSIRQVQFSLKAVLKFENGKTIWNEPYEILPEDD